MVIRYSPHWKALLAATLMPLLTVYAIACSSENSQPRSFEVTRSHSILSFDSAGVFTWDSSGIQVVWNEPSRISVVPDLSAQVRAVLRLGGYDAGSNESFAGLTDVQILPDSTIAVANGHFFTVGLFTLDGRWLRDVGRRGRGPGEYQHIGGLDLCDSGSLAVVDLLQDRMTVLSSEDFQVRRTIRLADAHSESTPSAAECMPDGRVIILGRGTGWKLDIPLGPYRVPMLLTLLGTDGSLAVDFGEVGAVDRYRQDMQDGPQYFGGTSAAVESQRFVYVTDPTEPIVRRYNLHGKLTAMIHTGQERKAITEADARSVTERVLQAARERGRSEGQLSSWRRFFRDYEYPDSFPAQASIIADDQGRIWIEEYSMSEDSPRKWRILSADGVLEAKLTLPPEFNLKNVSMGLLAGIGRDALDVPVVVVYGLDRNWSTGSRIDAELVDRHLQ